MTSVYFPIILHPRQREAFESPATEILFGGASRGGKSHLTRSALIAWCLEIPGLQCKIFRKFSDDVISNHMDSETGFRVMLAPLVKTGAVEIVATQIRFRCNGSLISLHHCQDEDLEKYQGRGTHVLVLDEATQLSEKVIKFLRGWVTMTEEMKATLPERHKDRFPRILYTANPIGASVGYFRRQFVKCRPAFTIEKVGAFLRQYIPSRVEDNPSEDAEAARLRLEDVGDKAMFDALYGGSWDAPIGDFYPEYSESRHVIPDLIPPAHWFRFRTFDWGNADPFAVYWYAVSDGEQFNAKMNLTDATGFTSVVEKTLWFPRGALICYREWYGCNPLKPSEGLRMRNEEIALGIRLRSPAPEEQNLQTLTDSYPFPDRGEGRTIADTFAANGVTLTLGKTSRITGWSQLRSRLIGIKPDVYSNNRLAMIFWCEGCTFIREYLPALPRHENEAKRADDAAEHGEATHSCDCQRLAAMAHEIVLTAPITPEQEQKHMRAVESKMRTEITFEQAIEIKRKERTNGHARY